MNYSVLMLYIGAFNLDGSLYRTQFELHVLKFLKINFIIHHSLICHFIFISLIYHLQWYLFHTKRMCVMMQKVKPYIFIKKCNCKPTTPIPPSARRVFTKCCPQRVSVESFSTFGLLAIYFWIVGYSQQQHFFRVSKSAVVGLSHWQVCSLQRQVASFQICVENTLI